MKLSDLYYLPHPIELANVVYGYSTPKTYLQTGQLLV
jgi:hypothetical protein